MGLFVLFFYASYGNVHATDFFWVTPAGVWNDNNVSGTGLSNWALSSGGSAVSTFPNSTLDTATIDAVADVVVSSVTQNVGTVDVTDPAAAIRIRAVAANGFLRVNQNVNNAGTIELTSDPLSTRIPILEMTSGTLTNTGSISVPDVGIGGDREIRGDLLNQGTIDVDRNLLLTQSGGQYTNAGLIEVDSAATVKIGVSNTFTQSGGTLNNQGIFTAASANFEFTGGDISGNPILLNFSDLTLGPAAGTGAFEVRGGSATDLLGDVQNSHVISLIAEPGSSNNNATFRSANSFSNAGMILMTSNDPGRLATLTLSSGTLTNTGTIHVQSGLGGFRTINASFDNQSLMDIDHDTNLSRSSGQYTNQASFDIAAGATVTQNVGSTFTQSRGTLDNQGGFSAASADFVVRPAWA